MCLERIPYDDPADQHDAEGGAVREIGDAFVRLCGC